jgi:hypothetical protein
LVVRDLLAVVLFTEELVEHRSDHVKAVAATNEVGTKSAAGNGGIETAIGAEFCAAELEGRRCFVEFGLFDGLADGIAVDAFEAEFLFEEAATTGFVRFAVLDPVAGEGLVVDVAPAFEPGDGGVDRVRGETFTFETVADFAFGAGAAGKQIHRSIDRFGLLVEGTKALDLFLRQPITGTKTLPGRDEGGEAEGERSIEEDADPVGVTLLGFDCRDASVQRRHVQTEGSSCAAATGAADICRVFYAGFTERCTFLARMNGEHERP